MIGLTEDPILRQEAVRHSHLIFFSVYFSDYITYELAFFHHEMIALTEAQKEKLIVVMAFRGSGKSTIMNTSYALWSILGEQQKKFVLIVSKTREQARAHFENIKNALLYNDLLKHDLGPFRESAGDWTTCSLELQYSGAKIMCLGAGQSVRGIKNGCYRPDLIIADDVEDMGSATEVEKRNFLYQWFLSELLASGNHQTKVIVLGNLLHRDSLIMKLKDKIQDKSIPGIFKAYPLLDDNGKILWPERYKNQQDIELLKSQVIDDDVWEREYLLKIILPKNTLNFYHYPYGFDSRSLAKSFEPPPPPPDENGYVISAPAIEGGGKLEINHYR